MSKSKMIWTNLTNEEKYRRTRKMMWFNIVVIAIAFWKLEIMQAILASALCLAASFWQLYSLKRKIENVGKQD